MPVILMQAYTVLALSWGWVRTAAAIRLCFFGLLRPGELLKGTRSDLVLAEDLCRDPRTDYRTYLNIATPKTRATGPREQFGRSDDPWAAWLWRSLVGRAAPHEKLWSAPVAAFRARWNHLSRRLDIPCNEVLGVTPASLRAGGASALYDATENIEFVRHRGRWTSAKMVEIYVQEVGGNRFFAQLPPETRDQVAALAARHDAVLQKALELLQSGAPVEEFPAAIKHVAGQTGKSG